MKIKIVERCAIHALLLWPARAQTQALLGNGRYPLKERGTGAETEQLTLDEILAIDLTFSDDSPPKSLQPFSIVLFDTDGNLPVDPSLGTVESALENFLIAELNAEYEIMHQVRQVNAKVLSQKATSISRKVRGRSRMLQKTGSDLEMNLNVTFAYEPSPTERDVNARTRRIMLNLQYFVTNLTSLAEGDEELANVNSAVWHDSTNSDNPDPVVTNTDDSSKVRDVQYIIPIVAGACIVSGFIAFFAIRKHNRKIRSKPVQLEDDGEDDDDIEDEVASPEVDVFYDEESEVFSFEATLVDSPRHGRKKKVGNDDASDIFSGIESMHTSPINAETQSFLSGFTRGDASASTIVASNVTHLIESGSLLVAHSITPGSANKSPHSRVSSLFTFSEEDEADLTSDESEKGKSGRLTRIKPVVEKSAKSPSLKVIRSPAMNIKGSDDSSEFGPSGTPPSETKQSAQFSTPNSQNVNFSHLFLSASDRSSYELGTSPDDNDVYLKAIQEAPAGDHSTESRSTTGSNSKGTPSVGSDSRSAGKNSVGQGSGGQHSSDQRSTFSLSVSNEQITPRSIQNELIDAEDENHWNIAAILSRSSSLSDAMKGSEGSLSDVLRGSHGSLSEALRDSSGPSTPVSDSGAAAPKNKRSPGDGYLSDPGPRSKKRTDRFGTSGRVSQILLDWGNASQASQNKEKAKRFAGSVKSTSDRSPSLSSEGSGSAFIGSSRGGRRHAKSTMADGTTNYQTEAMDPNDWSLTSIDGLSLDVTETSTAEERVYAIRPLEDVSDIGFQGQVATSPKSKGKSPLNALNTPKSQGTHTSGVSALTAGTNKTDGSAVTGATEASTNKKLISDLVWLEKKISTAKDVVVNSPNSPSPRREPRFSDRAAAATTESLGHPTRSEINGMIDQCDSLSFVSGDDDVSTSGSFNSITDMTAPTAIREEATKSVASSMNRPNHPAFESIVCRDCYAPPGKLKIVIHSTKDGPAVHTVKKGSKLEGHVFPGDLIISVDNVDTRSYTAEQVMKMMTAKTRYERKITVLHFEDQMKILDQQA